jgi:Na+:H+ antiporter, NhaA family
MYRVSPFVRHFARALVAGIGCGTLWVNLSPASYYDTVEYRLGDLPFGAGWTALPESVTPLGLIAGGLMALVLAAIAKEFWEALVLERDATRDAGGGALLPLAAIVGGGLGAVLVWLAVQQGVSLPEEARPGAGWPVAIGSDVILAYALGRLAFGPAHPALHLLLQVTVAFDVLGLLIAGLAFPGEGLMPAWLLLSALAVLAVWFHSARHATPDAPERLKRRALRLWPYVLAGVVCWAGVVLSGLPGALGLLPLIPVIPHADRTFGLFAEAEEHLHDPLNRLSHALVLPVMATLFLFGVTRGGIDFGAATPTTLVTLAALWIGKPLGLLAATSLVVARGLARLPKGMSRADLVVLALLTGMGFTVPALSIDISLPGGAMAEAARLGLFVSLALGALVTVVARLARRP